MRELICDLLFAFTESRLPDIIFSLEESRTCDSIIAELDDEVVSTLSTRTCEERVSILGDLIDRTVNSQAVIVLISMVSSELQKADARRIASNTATNQGEESSNADGPNPEILNHEVEEEDAH